MLLGKIAFSVSKMMGVNRRFEFFNRLPGRERIVK